MLTFDDWLKIWGSAGLITAAVSYLNNRASQAHAERLAHRGRVETAKCEAYLAYVEAYRQWLEAAAILHSTVEAKESVPKEVEDLHNSKLADFLVTDLRLLLVASPAVIEKAKALSKLLAESVKSREHRKIPLKPVVIAMREDLGWDDGSVAFLDVSNAL